MWTQLGTKVLKNWQNCFAKIFLVSMVLFLACFVSTSAIALPRLTDSFWVSPVMFAKVNSAKFNSLDLTPRQRQQVQAIRQRRNRDIQAALTTSQQEQLSKMLRQGDSLETSIDRLRLSNEQREMIEAVGQIYNLKLKALKFLGV